MGTIPPHFPHWLELLDYQFHSILMVYALSPTGTGTPISCMAGSFSRYLCPHSHNSQPAFRFPCFIPYGLCHIHSHTRCRVLTRKNNTHAPFTREQPALCENL